MPSFANVHIGIVAVDSIQSLAYVLKIGCFGVVQFYLLQKSGLMRVDLKVRQ